MSRANGTEVDVCEAGVALYESSAKSKKFAGAMGIMGVVWAGAGAMTLLAGAAPIIEIALAATAGVNLAGASLSYIWSSRARKEGARVIESALTRVGHSAIVSSLRHMKKDDLAVREAMDRVNELTRGRVYEPMETLGRETTARPSPPAAIAAAADEERVRASLPEAKEAKEAQEAQEAQWGTKNVDIEEQKASRSARQKQMDAEGRSESFEAQALALRDKKAAAHAAQEAARPASPAIVEVPEAKAPNRGRLRG